MTTIFKSATWWTGLALAGIGTGFFVLALDWETDRKVFPLFGSGFLILFAGIHTIVGVFREIETRTEAFSAAEDRSVTTERVRYFLWVLGFLVILAALGHRIGVPAFVILFMLSSGERWLTAIVSALVMWAFIFLVLENTVNILFPTGYLFRWIGV